jgi:AraC family transcriptional regulator
VKFEANTKDLPELNVVCLRHVGPYPEIGKAIEKLFGWAAPKGLLQFPQTQVLAIYHDDPKAVEQSVLRSDACITVPEGTEVDGEIKLMKVPGGRFAVAHVEIALSEYAAAWDKLFGEWMPNNNCEPDFSSGRFCYELYLNNPEDHPEKKHIVDICEPIQST